MPHISIFFGLPSRKKLHITIEKAFNEQILKYQKDYQKNEKKYQEELINAERKYSNAEKECKDAEKRYGDAERRCSDAERRCGEGLRAISKLENLNAEIVVRKAQAFQLNMRGILDYICKANPKTNHNRYQYFVYKS